VCCTVPLVVVDVAFAVVLSDLSVAGVLVCIYTVCVVYWCGLVGGGYLRVCFD
jgi:hypothetical protein